MCLQAVPFAKAYLLCCDDTRHGLIDVHPIIGALGYLSQELYSSHLCDRNLSIIRGRYLSTQPGSLDCALVKRVYSVASACDCWTDHRFMTQSVMSDSIVLWRMCIVWERARFVYAFGGVFLVAILGLNIANIVGNACGIFGDYGGSGYNYQDSEVVSTYGTNAVGLAAAFISLASNFCATMLVAIKAWYVIFPLVCSSFLLTAHRVYRR